MNFLFIILLFSVSSFCYTNFDDSSTHWLKNNPYFHSRVVKFAVDEINKASNSVYPWVLKKGQEEVFCITQRKDDNSLLYSMAIRLTMEKEDIIQVFWVDLRERREELELEGFVGEQIMPGGFLISQYDKNDKIVEFCFDHLTLLYQGVRKFTVPPKPLLCPLAQIRITNANMADIWYINTTQKYKAFGPSIETVT